MGVSALDGFDWDGTFVWDDTRRRTNAEKHRVDFALAGDLFTDPDRLTEQADIPVETRFKAIAAIQGRVNTVIRTPRERRIRATSLRRSRDAERRAYGDVHRPGPEGDDPSR